MGFDINKPSGSRLVKNMGKAFAGLFVKKFPEPQYKKITEEEVRIRMRDGVELSGFVYRPDKEGRFPVILVRNPYISGQMVYGGVLPFFAQQGYCCVLVSVRGALKSGGEWLPFEHETDDGYDIIEWIASQDWCDGNIGSYGQSYSGFVQWAVAGCGHPALKTMFIEVSGATPYEVFWRRGMFRMDVWTIWACTMMGKNRLKFMPPKPKEIDKGIRMLPQKDFPIKWYGEEAEWYQNWIRNEKPTDPYWSEGFWGHMQRSVKHMRIPVMMQGGWFDPFFRPEMNTFRILPEDVRKKSRFLIGPWNHGGSKVGDIELPNEKRDSAIFTREALYWFNYQLKGLPYPYRTGVVEAYEVRTGNWVIYDGDLKADKALKVYTCADGTLSFDGTVSSGKVKFEYDPEDPVETICGNALNNDGKNGGLGSKLQRKSGERSDVVSFVSGPLQEDITICGAIEADLYVGSDKPATAFTVVVSEVEPDGKAYNIRDDITDIRWKTDDIFEAYEPGEVAHLHLSMNDISWVVRKGNALRVDVSSSNFPLYSKHFNSTEPWYSLTEGKTAQQTIYCGGEHPTHITIPVRK